MPSLGLALSWLNRSDQPPAVRLALLYDTEWAGVGLAFKRGRGEGLSVHQEMSPLQCIDRTPQGAELLTLCSLLLSRSAVTYQIQCKIHVAFS